MSNQLDNFRHHSSNVEKLEKAINILETSDSNLTAQEYDKKRNELQNSLDMEVEYKEHYEYFLSDYDRCFLK